jgi:hypothetical protein
MELRVIDVFHLTCPNTRIVTVEVLNGGTILGIPMISPDAPGRWQFNGICTLPADYVASHRNEMTLRMINLDEGKEVRPGIRLVAEQKV